MRKHVAEVTVYGIDIGKNNFHVVGLDEGGKPVLHSKFRRDRLLVHFANTPEAKPPCSVSVNEEMPI